MLERLSPLSNKNIIPSLMFLFMYVIKEEKHLETVRQFRRILTALSPSVLRIYSR